MHFSNWTGIFVHVMKGEAKSRINQISLHFSDGGPGLRLFKCSDSTISVSDGTIVQGSFFFNASRATVWNLLLFLKSGKKLAKMAKSFKSWQIWRKKLADFVIVASGQQERRNASAIVATTNCYFTRWLTILRKYWHRNFTNLISYYPSSDV